jgi:hypothetical protein
MVQNTAGNGIDWQLWRYVYHHAPVTGAMLLIIEAIKQWPHNRSLTDGAPPVAMDGPRSSIGAPYEIMVYRFLRYFAQGWLVRPRYSQYAHLALNGERFYETCS